jgi:hypothetical protein
MISVAIAVVVVAAVLSATLAAMRHLAPDPVQSRLRELASSELAIAMNLIKYEGSTLTPASVATAFPMPAGSPLPVVLRLETRAAENGTVAITVNATSGAATAAVTATMMSRAPQPDARLHVRGIVPAPTGAP